MRLIGPPPPPTGAGSSHAKPNAVGGYPLLRILGVGGMSRVYLGFDRHTGAAVAVKVLADHLSGDQRFVDRFYREAVLARTLSHPSLVKGVDHGFDPTARCHFLAMEYVDGPTAREALERVGRFPVGVGVRVALGVAAGLEHLHAGGYVHRDVKPENVLLQPSPPAKLADLGLAKRTAGDAALTAANQGVGTPNYMSYEQSVNATMVDARSDVYSLGATLYHLLAGRVPYPESESRPTSRLAPCPPAASTCPEVPAAIDAILERMLAGDPRKRYAAVADAAAALRATGLCGTEEEYTAFVMRARGGSPPGADQPTKYDA